MTPAIVLMLVVAAADDNVQEAPDAVAESLARARKAFDALEYRASIPLAQAVLDATEKPADALTDDERRVRVAAFFMLGYGYAATDRVSMASSFFEQAMEIDVTASPDFMLEPFVQVILDAARAKRQKALAAGALAARRELMESVHLQAFVPGQVNGGERARIHVRVTDPRQIVASMRLDFRKDTEHQWYGLPMQRQRDGSFLGDIPGVYTRTGYGTRFFFHVTADDVDGEMLAKAGAADAPLVLIVERGEAVAQDLRANERLPTPTRVMFSLFGVSSVTAAFYLGGAALGAMTNAFTFDTAAAALGYVAYYAAPIAGALYGSFVSSYFLLDDWAPVITASVVGGTAALANLAWVGIAGQTISSNLNNPFGTVLTIGTVAVAAGIAGAVTSTVLVAADQPED